MGSGSGPTGGVRRRHWSRNTLLVGFVIAMLAGGGFVHVSLQRTETSGSVQQPATKAPLVLVSVPTLAETSVQFAKTDQGIHDIPYLEADKFPAGADDALTLDGSGFDGEQHQYTPLTVSLTTTSPDDVIVLFVETVGNQSACYTVTSVSDTGGLTWYDRGNQACFFYSAYGEHYSVEEYWALSGGVLQSDAITATTSSYGGNGAMVVYAVHGANTSAPFDDSTLLPAFTTLAFANVTTSNSNDLVLGINYEPDPYGNYGAGAGFTGVFEDTKVNWASEYTIVATPQSGLVMAYGAPAGLAILAAADAICAAGGSHCVAPISPAPKGPLTTSTNTTTFSSSSCSSGSNFDSCSTEGSTTASHSQTRGSGSSTTLQTSNSDETTSSGSATSLRSSPAGTQASSEIVPSVALMAVLLALVAVCVGGASAVIVRRAHVRRTDA